jgi:hypothetical protein
MMFRCLDCDASLGPKALIRIWTLRAAHCPACGAGHVAVLSRGARVFIQAFVGIAYLLTVLAGSAMGWSLIESSAAYLLGFVFAIAWLVLPFALTGKLGIRLTEKPGDHDR